MLVEQNSAMPVGSTGIDVIILYDRVGRGLELEMALFSVFQQTYSPIHVIVAMTFPSSAGLAEVNEIVGAYNWQERHVLPTVLPVKIPSGVDLRSNLLNSGLGLLRRRFVAFLDFDHCLYGHAYEHLTQIALEDEAAVAFGGIDVKHVRVFDSSRYNVRTIRDVFRCADVEGLVAEAFCPIHSFVADRTRIDMAQFYIDESVARFGHRGVLLRIAVAGRFSFRGVNKRVGICHRPVD